MLRLLLLIALLSLVSCVIVTPREFSSISELEAFLAADNTNQLVDPTWDCDDYARNLQRNALKAGKLLNVQVLGTYEKMHMVNLAIIGNDLVFIEPTEDRLFKRGYLDIEGE